MKRVKRVWDWIRGYNAGNPARNGEYHFLRQYIHDGMVVFDIGANVGEYSTYLLSLNPHLHIHCFEPVTATFGRLMEKMEPYVGQGRVVLNHMGMSHSAGSARIKVFGDFFGTNSLYERKSALKEHPTLAQFHEEVIDLQTIDAYRESRRILRIHLLKIDVEGHELKVLEGAKESFSQNRVDAIQFEYGESFLDAGITLGSVFELLRDYHFRVFRLLPFGKTEIKRFDPRLENNHYSNYVALLQGTKFQ